MTSKPKVLMTDCWRIWSFVIRLFNSHLILGSFVIGESRGEQGNCDEKGTGHPCCSTWHWLPSPRVKWLLRNRQIRTWIWPWGESQEIPMQGQAGRQLIWWGGRGIQAGGFSCLCGSSKLIKFVYLFSNWGRCKLYITVLRVLGVDLFLVSVLAGEICKWTWRYCLFQYVFSNLCGVFEISWTSFATVSSILLVESYMSKRSKGKTE